MRERRGSRRGMRKLQGICRITVEALEERRLLSADVSSAPLLQLGSDGTLSAAVLPNAGADVISGGLDGKVLFTSGGHGYVWRPPGYNSAYPNGYWGIMRSYGYNFMEDMGNQDQLQPYADYALRSGATVVAMRPIGHQVNEVVMDDAMGYSAATGGFQVISGNWQANTLTAPYWSVNNGNDADHWKFASASATETAVARYTPNIPAAGFYPVYEWENPGTNGSSNDLVSDQTYRINYTGGSAEVRVAVNKVGNGWVYLGTYYFAQGVSGANVEVSNKTAGTVAGKYVVADGIRFGNGMGDWTGNGTHPVSGYSREDECALYWCYDQLGWTGNGTRVAQNVVDASNVSGFQGLADENKNFFACDRYAAYMNNANVGNRDDRLWISFHSNGSGSAGEGGAARGTLGLINSVQTTNQTWLAETAGYTVQQEMAAAGFNWYIQGNGTESLANNTVTGGYSEISGSSTYTNNEFDATIIEVAYHDNATDNALLKNPAVRDAVGRASYHTAVKYFQTYDALSNLTLLPEAPVDVRATTDAAGNVTVAWGAGPSSSGLSGPYGNAATSYLVHTSTNGYGFDGGVSTTGTSLTFTALSTTAPTYFMVTAVNAGGESEESYVVVAKPQAGRHAPILIVNNFSRMDGVSDQIETKSFGTVYRARARYNNSHDYAVQAASALAAYNGALGVDSASDAAVAAGEINLSNYAAVIWMSGEQSSVDGTFRGAAATAVTNYVNAGGKLFVSGSEIAWDLGHLGNGPTFLANTLHASYVADSAGTHSFNSGLAGSALAGVSAAAFDDGTHGTYDVDFPDVLGTASGSQIAMYYAGGTQAAAVQWAGANGAKVLYLGFPIESVYSDTGRTQIVAAAMNYFGLNVSLAPGAADLAANSDTGASSSDNLTRLNNSAGRTLQFAVANTVPGAVERVYADGALIGLGAAAGSTLTITTNGSAPLADGSHAITVTQQEPGLAESAPLGGLTVVIDTAGPVLTLADQTFQATDSTGSSINFAPAGVTDAHLQAVTYAPAIGSVFPLGVTPIVVTATDLAGNVASGSFRVSVVDPAFLVRGTGGAYRFTTSGGAQTLHITGGTVTLVATVAQARPGIALAVDAGTAVAGADQFFSALSVADGATLDLATHGMAVDYPDGAASPLGTIQQWVAQAARDAASGRLLWTGTGITSSAARALALHQAAGVQTTLGLAEASDYTARTGQTAFAGVPLDDSAVVIKYTYAGDATLDGKVDDTDVDVVYAHYQDSRRAAQYTPFYTNRTYSDGDFTFDGMVDDRDLDILSLTYDPLRAAI